MNKLKAAILGGAMAGIFSWAYALGDLTLDGVTKDYVSNTGQTTLLNSHITQIRVIGELKLNNTTSNYVHQIGEMVGVNSAIESLDATGDIHLLKSKIGRIDAATMHIDLSNTTISGDVIINRKWDSFFNSFSWENKEFKPTQVTLNGSRIEGTLNCITQCVIERNNSYIANVEGKTNSQ